MAGSDPAAVPAIVHNWLEAEADQTLSLKAMQLARALIKTQALADLVDSEAWPGADLQSEDDLLDYARAYGNTAYHPVGTCRMGIDPDAVVDPHLRVRGVEGLRVIDASIMPRLVSGNTNAAAMMIAEKGADLVQELSE